MQYQYAELAELEQTTSFRAALGVEVLFVLPYGRSDVADWVSIIPKQVATVDAPRPVHPLAALTPATGQNIPIGATVTGRTTDRQNSGWGAANDPAREM